MNQQDGFKAAGKLTIEIKDKHGNVKDKRDLTNLVVDDGLGFIASRMKDTPDVMSHRRILHVGRRISSFDQGPYKEQHLSPPPD